MNWPAISVARIVQLIFLHGLLALTLPELYRRIRKSSPTASSKVVTYRSPSTAPAFAVLMSARQDKLPRQLFLPVAFCPHFCHNVCMCCGIFLQGPAVQESAPMPEWRLEANPLSQAT